MIQAITFASILTAVLSLGSSYWAGGYFNGTGVIGGFGLLWLLAAWRHWRWFSEIGLAGGILTAGLAISLGLSPTPSLIALTTSLAAWDLMHFQSRLRLLQYEGGTTEEIEAFRKPLSTLERRHLAFLSLFLVPGFALGLTALSLRVQLNFWPAFLLVVIATGIVQLVRWLQKSAETAQEQ